MSRLTRRQMLLAGSLLTCLNRSSAGTSQDPGEFPPGAVSDFCRSLKPVGRVLELEDWYVWCASPIYGPNGEVHLFVSRWPAARRMGGWINSSEIARAVADTPEGPFRYVENVLSPRGAGFWDGTTCHNPHIQQVDGRYCLFYMGNSNGKTDTKRIGLAVAERLEGPWRRSAQPLIEPSAGEAAWDNHCTSNPSFVKGPDGRYWLYYKSWNSADYERAVGQAVRGNRKYGLAVAERLEGPYIKHPANPVIDLSARGNNTQLEDAFVWRAPGGFTMIARDMGVFGHKVGLHLESSDGIGWSEPKVAYLPLDRYAQEPPPAAHLTKYGRLERPQLLLKKGRPSYLFTAAQGGAFMNSSPFVLRIAGTVSGT